VRLSEALEQSWPAFVLVTGLLLVGLAAHTDGLFLQAGLLLERVPGPPAALLIASMSVVAVVTAVLNLDTSVVFLTPVLILAARQRGVSEEPFLFSAIFMSNASSLYLPGSNLTNLLVLSREPISGGAFAARMFAPALAATLATAAGLLFLFRHQLSASEPRSPAPADPTRRVGPGLLATVAAVVLILLMRDPALAVLAVGMLAVGCQLVRRQLRSMEVLRAVGPLVLAGLFAVSVALGVLAREWDGPARLLGQSGSWGTAAVGAASALAVNNLPAAVLLSARPLAHPRALLLGLNLAPNLAVSGSLSAYLWFRAAAQLGPRPSIAAFSRRGLLLAPLALVVALTLTSLVGGAA
jgi:arsenical pump membrane protein